MIYFSKFSDSVIDGGKRLLKVLQFGAKSADECLPFGVDSNPIKNMTAIYAETSNDSESVIIGYINENQLAQSGETRLFSVDSNGALKSYVWLKNNGDIELNGNNYSSVRFEPLNVGLNSEKDLINAELVKIATAINAIVPGSYTPLPITLDISNAKNDTVKLS